ncbi:MAG TPA: response regulator [Gaiellaceae bacterium]
MAGEIRVLIADDHAVVRQGLRVFLDLVPDVEVVGEAENGLEAIEQVRALRPDVVVMDMVMPQMDGIAATKKLREEQPAVQVLALSSFTDDDRVLPALGAGAGGFLTKGTNPAEIAEAIRKVHRGEPVLCAEATRRVLHRLYAERARPEGTVTVLFTDIEGSTRLLEELGDARARELFRAHDALVRDSIDRAEGVEVEREGDAFMIAFSSARRAIQCALDIQRTLARSDLPLRVRAGLNTGEVIAEEHGYFGRSVFVASRIAGTAAGGEILVSELTRNLVDADGVGFRDRGPHVLKGLKGTYRLYEAEWTE